MGNGCQLTAGSCQRTNPQDIHYSSTMEFGTRQSLLANLFFRIEKWKNMML
jgi:hypothetical protein